MTTPLIIFLESKGEMVDDIDQDDINMLVSVSTAVKKNYASVYIDIFENDKRYEIDVSFATKILTIFSEETETTMKLYLMNVEGLEKNEKHYQIPKIKQVAENASYDKDIIFENLHKMHISTRNFLFLIKKKVENGVHVDTYRLTYSKPYYVKDGISLDVIYDVAEIRNKFNRKNIEPYFITGYDYYQEGELVFKIDEEAYEGRKTFNEMKDKEYNIGLDSVPTKPTVINDMHNKRKYKDIINSLNVLLKKEYNYLHDFLSLDEDGIFIMNKPEEHSVKYPIHWDDNDDIFNIYTYD